MIRFVNIFLNSYDKKIAVRRGGRTQVYNVLYLCGRYYGVDWRVRKDYFKITHKTRILLTQYLTFNMSQTATTSTNPFCCQRISL